MSEKTYTVTGMTCEHCVDAVTERGQRRGRRRVGARRPRRPATSRSTGEGFSDDEVARGRRRGRLRARLTPSIAADWAADRPAGRRHDLRVVRRADREEAQPRSTASTATVNYATEQATVRYDPRRSAPDDLVAAVEATGYSAALPPRAEPPTPLTDGSGRARRARAAAAAADRCRRCWPCRCSLLAMVPGAAVRQLAVALAGAGQPGGRLGRLAVPPRRLAQPAPRRGDDGHPRLPRHAGRLRLVAVRAVLRRRRHARMRCASS